jgi:hypothetical protein
MPFRLVIAAVARVPVAGISVATVPAIVTGVPAPTIPTVVSPIVIAAVVIPAVVISPIVVATVVAVVEAIEAPVIFQHPDLLQPGIELAIVVAILIAIVVDHDHASVATEPIPVIERAAPVESPVGTADDLDPDLLGPIAIVARVSVAIPVARFDPHPTTDRTSATDPDVGANALCAGSASRNEGKKQCRAQTYESKRHSGLQARLPTAVTPRAISEGCAKL